LRPFSLLKAPGRTQPAPAGTWDSATQSGAVVGHSIQARLALFTSWAFQNQFLLPFRMKMCWGRNHTAWCHTQVMKHYVLPICTHLCLVLAYNFALLVSTKIP
jgi:hypothetical protein